ncbi:MAG: metallophosphatase domain-containing protein [Granulosicoccus sp.]
MRLVCISDTHGDHEQLELPPGDVLIHAGDLTAHGKREETQAVMRWLGAQKFAHKLCVAGNHDDFMEDDPESTANYASESGVVLLSDSGISIDGVSFWGSPITPRFLDWSFMRDPGAPIEAHWDLIPDSTDVLITHGPPYGILDEVIRKDGGLEHAGCPSLLKTVRSIAPSFHLFGHIHEGRGRFGENNVSFCNISTMNEHYQITHPPVVIDIGDSK